jgi:hypothetical protein
MEYTYSSKNVATFVHADSSILKKALDDWNAGALLVHRVPDPEAPSDASRSQVIEIGRKPDEPLAEIQNGSFKLCFESDSGPPVMAYIELSTVGFEVDAWCDFVQHNEGLYSFSFLTPEDVIINGFKTLDKRLPQYREAFDYIHSEKIADIFWTIQKYCLSVETRISKHLYCFDKHGQFVRSLDKRKFTLAAPRDDSSDTVTMKYDCQ